MRIVGEGNSGDRARGKRALSAAVESGYTLFDHADIYGAGHSEELFGEFLRESPSIRDQLAIATKCGVRFAGDDGGESPARYDCRHDYILQCVEGSLRRLGVEQVELLLLHRPDYLMRAEEIAVAFDELYSSGKVANFGVSNFSVRQVDLLRSRVTVPLIVNQIEINIHNINALLDGTLDQCQQLGITPQAWCPIAGVAYPAWGNTFAADDDNRIRAELERQMHRYDVQDWQIALAWLLKHPAGISPIVGSTTPSRIAAATDSLDVEYSREDWYRLLEARNGRSVP